MEKSNNARPAVIFDRDGTLIVDMIYLNEPDRIEFLPGVFEALRLLRDAGYAFAVATNQSGVPRGLVQLENLAEIHRRIHQRFATEGCEILSFHSAPYMTDSDHPMRKPGTGMLMEAADQNNFDLSKSWMIGDRMTDVEAGHRAGCRTVLLGDLESPIHPTFKPPTIHAADLLSAAKQMVAR